VDTYTGGNVGLIQVINDIRTSTTDPNVNTSKPSNKAAYAVDKKYVFKNLRTRQPGEDLQLRGISRCEVEAAAVHARWRYLAAYCPAKNWRNSVLSECFKKST